MYGVRFMACFSTKDSCKRRAREWRKNNLERKSLNNRRRRAIKKLARIEPYTVEQLQVRLSLWDGCCAYCGADQGITVDHFIPLAKGGADRIANLVPACRRCNCSKNAADAWEWYSRQQFFCEERWQKIQEVLNHASH